MSSEQEDQLRRQRNALLKQFQRSWRHLSAPIPSALPLQLQFALQAKESDMLENTSSFMAGESRAGAVSGEAGAWGCEEFAINNSQPLLHSASLHRAEPLSPAKQIVCKIALDLNNLNELI